MDDVERVARAMCADQDEPDTYWPDFVREAKLAIAAMPEIAALRAENARLRAGIADMVASIRRNTEPYAEDIAEGLIGGGQ